MNTIHLHGHNEIQAISQWYMSFVVAVTFTLYILEYIYISIFFSIYCCAMLYADQQCLKQKPPTLQKSSLTFHIGICASHASPNALLFLFLLCGQIRNCDGIFFFSKKFVLNINRNKYECAVREYGPKCIYEKCLFYVTCEYERIDMIVMPSKWSVSRRWRNVIFDNHSSHVPMPLDRMPPIEGPLSSIESAKLAFICVTPVRWYYCLPESLIHCTTTFESNMVTAISVRAHTCCTMRKALYLWLHAAYNHRFQLRGSNCFQVFCSGMRFELLRCTSFGCYILKKAYLELHMSWCLCRQRRVEIYSVVSENSSNCL